MALFIIKCWVGCNILMKSFGLWYEKCENKLNYISREKENSNHTGENISVLKEEDAKKDDELHYALHVNFWSLEDIKTNGNIKEPYLDIGIKIDNYKSLKKLVFFCPFKLGKDCIQDLSEKFSIKSNANIIFNDDCEIETKDNYTIIQLTTKERLLVFPLFTVINNVCEVEEIQNSEGTKIIFAFERFHNYVKEVDKLRDIRTIYIRFRVKNLTLRDYIYFDSEPLNKSFESAFSGTRIIDFKVNEKRNIEDSVRTETIVNKETWAVFENVHFLAMLPSSYDLTSFCEEQMTCRELEQELWDDYLGTSIDFNKGHVLAYHWRKKKDTKPIDDFSCLVKVNYSKTKVKTIFTYALSVVALGMLGSIAATAIEGTCKGVGVAIVILICALLLGKIK